MGQMIDYQRPDGAASRGWLVEPDNPDAPGIVVIQEWWGLDEPIKDVAAQFASAGYRVLVPDLYRGQLTLEAKEAEHLMNGLDFADAAAQDIRGAARYLLHSGSPRVGVTGYCMGGALTVLSAMLVPESVANVIWYGYPPLEYVDASKIQAPLLGHFATLDEFFPIAGVDALAETLRAAGVDFEFHRYEAKHAFASKAADQRKLPPLGYSPEAATQAWERTLAFFARHLR